MTYEATRQEIIEITIRLSKLVNALVLEGDAQSAPTAVTLMAIHNVLSAFLYKPPAGFFDACADLYRLAKPVEQVGKDKDLKNTN